MNRALARVLESFWNDPQPEAAVAAFNAERDRLERECLERYQPETGKRIVLAARQILVTQTRAAMADGEARS